MRDDRRNDNNGRNDNNARKDNDRDLKRSGKSDKRDYNLAIKELLEGMISK